MILAFAVLLCVAHGAVLIIDPTNTSTPIPSTFLGLNLEHTRHDIWLGLSAQKIANRQFMAQPPGTSGWPVSWKTSWPPRWEPIGQVVYSPSNHAMVCTYPITNGNACGVSQGTYFGGFNSGLSFGSSIDMQGHEAYTLEVMVSANVTGSSNVEALVTLVDPNHVIFLNVTLHILNTVTPTEYRVPVQSNLNGYNLTFTFQWLNNESITGNVSLFATSLLPQSEINGLNLAAVSALQGLKQRGPLRFPGGCFTPFYRWEDALQPLLNRPVVMTPPSYCAAVAGGVNAYSDGFQQDVINIDEYIALTRQIGVTPALTVSMQYGTDAEIANAKAFVEYCNGDAKTTRYGALRASRIGRHEPYNVSHWYLGNEINLQTRYPNYPAEPSRTDPAASGPEYTTMLQRLIPAMMAASPNTPLKLFAVEGNPAWDSAWLANNNVTDNLHAASYHGGYSTLNPIVTPNDFLTAAKTPTNGDLYNALKQIRQQFDKATLPRNHKIGISADEWGLGPPWIVAKFHVAHALYGASFLSSTLAWRDMFGIDYTNYFEPINEGALTTTVTETVTPTPVAVVLQIWANITNNNCSQVNIPLDAYYQNDDVIAVGALCGREGRLVVLLTNRNPTSSVKQTIQIVTQKKTSTVYLQMWVPTSVSAEGVFQYSEKTVNISQGSFEITLSPYSITQLNVDNF